jgi:hypothetical protein
LITQAKIVGPNVNKRADIFGEPQVSEKGRSVYQFKQKSSELVKSAKQVNKEIRAKFLIQNITNPK